MSRRAVILAGGKGTRLHPYSIAIPKPLVPVGEYPILEIVIRQLVREGFDRITIAVNHQADIIMAYFGDGARWSVSIDYSIEQQPLGTMGPLNLIADLPDDFIVMNGDILTDISYSRVLDDHIEGGNTLTVASFVRTQSVDYGVLEIDDSNIIVGFQEKPKVNKLVSMGVYAVNGSALGYIQKSTFFGFDQLVHALIESNDRVVAYPYAGFWLDIGRPDDYEAAILAFEKKSRIFLHG